MKKKSDLAYKVTVGNDGGSPFVEALVLSLVRVTAIHAGQLGGLVPWSLSGSRDFHLGNGLGCGFLRELGLGGGRLGGSIQGGALKLLEPVHQLDDLDVGIVEERLLLAGHSRNQREGFVSFLECEPELCKCGLCLFGPGLSREGPFLQLSLAIQKLCSR